MNQIKFSAARIQNIKYNLRSGKNNMLMQKYNFELKNGKLFLEGKEVVGRDNIDTYLDAEVKNGGPLSIEQLHWWVQDKAVGISRRRIKQYFEQQESYQMLKRRPKFSSRENKHRREGSTSWVTNDDQFPNCIGGDLFSIPDIWSSYDQLAVFVHKKSRYTWGIAINGATAQATLTAFKNHVYPECVAHFGHPGLLLYDGGGEAKGVFLEWLKKKME